MNFKQKYQKYQQQFDNFLQAYTQDLLKQSGNNLAVQAASYSLTAPGKRLRPIMALVIYQALQSNQSAKKKLAPVIQVCASLELLHTFSLIHDDLPALDNDELRRGLPTCHRQFNEASAILAGDFLLNQAYSNLADSSFTDKQKSLALKVFSEAVQALIIGEQSDLLGEKRILLAEELSKMIAGKTGAMFAASLALGAVLAGETNLEPYKETGQILGLAFQIQDDVLDIIGQSESLGKKTGRDQQAQKSTWVQVHGLVQAQADYLQAYQQAQEQLQKILPENQEKKFLLALLDFLQERDR